MYIYLFTVFNMLLMCKMSELGTEQVCADAVGTSRVGIMFIQRSATCMWQNDHHESCQHTRLSRLEGCVTKLSGTRVLTMIYTEKSAVAGKKFTVPVSSNAGAVAETHPTYLTCYYAWFILKTRISLSASGVIYPQSVIFTAPNSMA